MLFVVCRLVVVVSCSCWCSFCARCLLFVVRCRLSCVVVFFIVSLFVVYCSWCVVWSLVVVVCCVLFVVSCSLVVACCMFGCIVCACCLLFGGCCLLSCAVRCYFFVVSLFVVCCL